MASKRPTLGALTSAHKHSSGHRDEIVASDKCGCFYCLAIFKPSEIEEWVDDDRTALCPQCGVDSVLSVGSGFPATDIEFLQSMHNYWFER